jgi:hypothetical protein
MLNGKQILALWLGILPTIAMGLYPPWIITSPTSSTGRRVVLGFSLGYRLLRDPLSN